MNRESKSPPERDSPPPPKKTPQKTLDLSATLNVRNIKMTTEFRGKESTGIIKTKHSAKLKVNGQVTFKWQEFKATIPETVKK